MHSHSLEFCRSLGYSRQAGKTDRRYSVWDRERLQHFFLVLNFLCCWFYFLVTGPEAIAMMWMRMCWCALITSILQVCILLTSLSFLWLFAGQEHVKLFPFWARNRSFDVFDNLVVILLPHACASDSTSCGVCRQWISYTHFSDSRCFFFSSKRVKILTFSNVDLRYHFNSDNTRRCLGKLSLVRISSHSSARRCRNMWQKPFSRARSTTCTFRVDE